MNRYLLIESQDPFESRDVGYVSELAQSLVRDGAQVTLFLVGNGVLPARPGAHSEALSALSRAGVRVLADDFSLRERGIRQERLCPGVAASAIDEVIDRLAAGDKAIWH
jgi:predicted peroxiredoxin